jgi:hypothetical protein
MLFENTGSTNLGPRAYGEVSALGSVPVLGPLVTATVSQVENRVKYSTSQLPASKFLVLLRIPAPALKIAEGRVCTE